MILVRRQPLEKVVRRSCDSDKEAAMGRGDGRSKKREYHFKRDRNIWLFSLLKNASIMKYI